MQVILIRHGKTAGNAGLCYIGRTDEPLIAEGRDQAAQRQDTRVKKVWVSALVRTQQTAAIMFPNALQIKDDRFNEMDFGDFEGKNFESMSQNADYRAWVDGGCVGACPNGESRSVFSRRVCNAFVNALKSARGSGDETAVFVVHGGTIMAILESFALPKKDYYSYAAKNCTGYVCDVCTDPQGGIVLKNLSEWGQSI